MRILVDMNLPPRWTDVLKTEGHDARHWTTVGSDAAPDHTLMTWARRHERIVFTHDLDFSAILAASQADGPSVVQLRTDDVLPATHAETVLRALRQFETELTDGAILSVDPKHARVRSLPLPE